MAVTVLGAEQLTGINNVDASRDIEVAQTDLFGKVWAPGSLGEFAALIQWEFLGPGDLSGWRGQADIAWPLHSSAYRRLKNLPQGWLLDDDALTESAMCEYEKRLLGVARLAGHGRTDGRRLADLGLLAKLQHHGAATRLVDFTSNGFVALWFACRALPGTWGVVFGARLEGCWPVSDEERLEAGCRTLWRTQTAG